MTNAIVPTKKPAISKKKAASMCNFAFNDSRLCAMPRWKKNSKYCLFHAHQAQQLLNAAKLGDELTTPTGEFRTYTDLNHALGNLFKAVAENRIPPRSAAALAYIGQLLQQNIPSVQDEIVRIDGEEGLERVLREALDAHDGGTERADQAEEDRNNELIANREPDVPARRRDINGRLIARPEDGKAGVREDRPDFADPNHYPVYRFHPRGPGAGCWTVLTEPLPEPSVNESEGKQG